MDTIKKGQTVFYLDKENYAIVETTVTTIKSEYGFSNIDGIIDTSELCEISISCTLDNIGEVTDEDIVHTDIDDAFIHLSEYVGTKEHSKDILLRKVSKDFFKNNNQ